MSKIMSVCLRDFRAYFLAPKGGVIVWFFLIFIGFFFHSFVVTFFEMQQRSPMSGGEAPGLDQLITAIFHNLHFILLLAIPAITMASFAEERKLGTLKLLQSSPLKASQIVLGKFFASTGFLGFCLLLSLVFPFYLISYGNPDVAPIAASYLGIFLLICLQVSFGLWISSMSRSQMMAFILTMFGLFLMLILNWIAPNVTSGDGIESAVKYLATTTHLDVFLKGMITVSDVTFFLAFTGLFLFLTNVSLDSERWR